MKLIANHLEKQGISYITHLRFALKIAWRLLHSVLAFTIHAVFPFVSIRRDLDLEATAHFIHDCNVWIEGKKIGGLSNNWNAKRLTGQ